MQSIFYLLGFYLTWPFLLVVLSTDFNTTSHPLWLLTVTLLPFQGLHNFLVFIRPRLIKWRAKRKETPQESSGSIDPPQSSDSSIVPAVLQYACLEKTTAESLYRLASELEKHEFRTRTEESAKKIVIMGLLDDANSLAAGIRVLEDSNDEDFPKSYDEVFLEVPIAYPESNEEAFSTTNEEGVSENSEEGFHERNEETVPEINEEGVPERNEEGAPENNEEGVPENNEEDLPESIEEAVPKSNEGAVPKSNEGAVPKSNEGAFP